MQMQCPRCSSRLTAKRIGRLEIDECAECGGKWLDHGELERLTTGAATPEAVHVVGQAESQTELLTCPRCERPDLVPIEHGQPGRPETVTIDVCKTCHGVWLDRGELEQLRELAGGRDGGPIRWTNLYEPDRPLDLPMDLMF